MEQKQKPVIAMTIGDPAGIGPEIVLKAMKDDSILQYCRPIIIGHLKVLDFYNKLLKLGLNFHLIKNVKSARFMKDHLDVMDIENVLIPEVKPGENNALNGQAMLSYTEYAIELASQKEVDYIIAGPHTKKSVELAGIKFDGYPSFVAKLTNTSPDKYFLMLVSANFRIVNVTLHVSLREALDMIHKDRIYKRYSQLTSL